MSVVSAKGKAKVKVGAMGAEKAATFKTAKELLHELSRESIINCLRLYRGDHDPARIIAARDTRIADKYWECV